MRLSITLRVLLCVLAVTPAALSAQLITFNFTDGSSASYPMEQVRSTDFNGTAMRVFLWDGTEYSWDMTVIDNYQFNDLATGLSEGGASSSLSPISVFPNPSSGEVTIAFMVSEPGDVKVEVFDRMGNLVQQVNNGHLQSGQHSLRWNGKDGSGRPVTSGAYLCRVIQKHHAISKQVIIEY